MFESCLNCPKRKIGCKKGCEEYLVSTLLNEVNKNRIKEEKQKGWLCKGIRAKRFYNNKTLLSTHRK